MRPLHVHVSDGSASAAERPSLMTRVPRAHANNAPQWLHSVLGNLSVARRVPFPTDLAALAADVEALRARWGNGSIHYGQKFESGWKLLQLRSCSGSPFKDGSCRSRVYRATPC